MCMICVVCFVLSPVVGALQISIVIITHLNLHIYYRKVVAGTAGMAGLGKKNSQHPHNNVTLHSSTEADE